MKLTAFNSSPIYSQNMIDGFISYNRFIMLNTVNSKSIPNIIDLVFNSLHGVDFIENSVPKTSVTVINTSEVYGNAHGLSDIRDRNVYIHYGFIDENIDTINGNSTILFTNVDWNVLIDHPNEESIKKDYVTISEINVSYDNYNNGGVGANDGIEYYYRDGYNNIIIPRPNYYEEKDMLLMGDIDETYLDELYRYVEYGDPSNNNLFSLKLSDLVDSHTKIYKMNINIENLSTTNKNICCFDDDVDDINYYIQTLASKIKYTLEVNGFSGADIILSGDNGFNLTRLKTHLNLHSSEIHIFTRLLFTQIGYINDEFMYSGYGNDINIFMHFGYNVVDVKIIDKTALFEFEKDKCISDILGKDLSNTLYYSDVL